jgi:hypothetical protein
MDHFKQRVALKFLFLKGQRHKAAHIELSSVLGEQAYSLSQAKGWIRRFKDGGISCEDDDYIFHSDQTFGLQCISPRKEIQTELFTAVIAPELSKENSNYKRRVDKTELIAHMDNSMCHNGRKIQEYFARKNDENPHPVYSPDLLPCDSWFFG